LRKVYLNHDGGVDDLVSLYLLLKMEDVELVGVGVIEADCYLEPAVEASKKIIQKFGRKYEESTIIKIEPENVQHHSGSRRIYDRTKCI